LCLAPTAVAAATAGESAGVVATLVLLVWLVPRALRLGVTLDDHICTIRNVFRTHRISVADVERFDFDYSWVNMWQNEIAVAQLNDQRRIVVTGLGLPRQRRLQRTGRQRLGRMNAALRRRQHAHRMLQPR
jgi:hypothetical protein